MDDSTPHSTPHPRPQQVIGHLDVDPPLNDAELEALTLVGLEGGWTPCVDGCCLLVMPGSPGRPRTHTWLAADLRRLVQEHLRPRRAAHAPDRHGFTYDHRLDGMLVFRDGETGQLCCIVVRDNRVRERVLHPADACYLDADLPHPPAVDTAGSVVRRRRRRQTVINLAARIRTAGR